MIWNTTFSTKKCQSKKTFVNSISILLSHSTEIEHATVDIYMMGSMRHSAILSTFTKLLFVIEIFVCQFVSGRLGQVLL